MPDGEFFARDYGYTFSEKDSGITLEDDAPDSFLLDVAFVKEGKPNRVFTSEQLTMLERNPIQTMISFQIPEEELVKARQYLGDNPKYHDDMDMGADDHSLTMYADDDLSL